MNAIDQLHLDRHFIGSHQLCHALVTQGNEVSRLHVQTPMLKMGILALEPMLGTTQRSSQQH